MTIRGLSANRWRHGRKVFAMWIVGFLAASVLIIVPSPVPEASAQAGADVAVLITKKVDPTTTRDVMVESRLESLGLTVVPVSHNDADGLDLALANPALALVVVSATVDPAITPGIDWENVIRPLTIPVLTWEHEIYVELGMANSAGKTQVSTKGLAVLDNNHPVADALEEKWQIVLDTPSWLPWAKLTSGEGLGIARPGDPNKRVLFTYESAADLADLTPAAARRVGFFFGGDSPAKANSTAWGMFDASVNWLLGRYEGFWTFNEAVGATSTANLIKPAVNNGTLRPQTDIGNGTVDFPGWQLALGANGILDPGSDVLPNAFVSEVFVNDEPTAFDPRGDAFEVVLRFRAEPLPSLSTDPAEVSYNMMQKGKSGDAGGFYKIELLHSNSTGGLYDQGKLRCFFRENLAAGHQAVNIMSTDDLSDGEWHTVKCGYDPDSDQATMVVDGVTETPVVMELGDIAPSAPSAQRLVIGKKPGSAAAEDAFAGEIDFIGWLRRN